MRRALMWLNLYGREAVRHKLKNGLKTQFLLHSHENQSEETVKEELVRDATQFSTSTPYFEQCCR
jgi:hypothetical protein